MLTCVRPGTIFGWTDITESVKKKKKVSLAILNVYSKHCKTAFKKYQICNNNSNDDNYHCIKYIL